MSDETVAKRDSEPAEDSLIVQPGRGALKPPFQPGQSGNPNGRPKDTERLLDLMIKRHPGVLSGAADALAQVVQDRDSKHWLGAVRTVLERREGPVEQVLRVDALPPTQSVVLESSSKPPALPDVSTEALAGQLGVSPQKLAEALEKDRERATASRTRAQLREARRALKAQRNRERRAAAKLKADAATDAREGLPDLPQAPEL